jgi:hypothetical protein
MDKFIKFLEKFKSKLQNNIPIYLCVHCGKVVYKTMIHFTVLLPTEINYWVRFPDYAQKFGNYCYMNGHKYALCNSCYENQAKAKYLCCFQELKVIPDEILGI